MDEQAMVAAAQKVYTTILNAIQARNWTCDRFDNELGVKCTISGDDLNIQLKIFVDIERQLIIIYSSLPFTVKSDASLNTSVAIAAINNLLSDGNFEYDVNGALIRFRLTASFLGSEISENLVQYMIDLSLWAVDEFNEKLFALTAGYLSIQDLLSQFNL